MRHSNQLRSLSKRVHRNQSVNHFGKGPLLRAVINILANSNQTSRGDTSPRIAFTFKQHEQRNKKARQGKKIKPVMFQILANYYTIRNWQLIYVQECLWVSLNYHNLKAFKICWIIFRNSGAQRIRISCLEKLAGILQVHSDHTSCTNQK